MGRRLSVCYAAPGHRLVATAGTARNMLSLAEALSDFADVTLAFRRTPRCTPAERFALAIDPGGPDDDEEAVDDVAQRGLDPLGHLAYMRKLRQFAGNHHHMFDIVLEKGWRLSGTLSAQFRRHGIPGVVVQNDVRAWSEAIRDVRTCVRYGMHVAADVLARREWTRMPVIAETQELKTMLVRRGARPELVEVIGLGIDHRLFRPTDQAEARRWLGLDVGTTMLVYVGAMDGYHDLTPVIEALAARRPRLELHVVGDGNERAACEKLAAELCVTVHFHGRRPHASIPTYITAADACVVAYREGAFPGRVVPFSTLKVPEYMACARAVVGNAVGQARTLLEDGISGRLFTNDAASWSRFFADIPTREHLAEMGRAAAKAAEALSWHQTAARYFELCERVVRTRGRNP